VTSEITAEVARLPDLDSAALVARYRELFGEEPRLRRRDWLVKRIAWRIQANAYGGLSPTAQQHLAEITATLDLPDAAGPNVVRAALPRRREVGVPSPGTTLTRVWNGTEIQVRVLESGFEWNGVTYRSLSAVAAAITGAHWNGRLFFGLVERRRGA